MADTSLSTAKLTTYADPKTLAAEVASWILRLAQGSGERFSLCLSGGSTPKTLYECMARPDYAKEFPWEKTHFFFGDERFVPAGDKDNNFTMANNAMLAHVPVPKANVHRFVTEVESPERCAEAYEAELKRFYGADQLDPSRPLFDVNLLGLGPDGHTASLIPEQPVLDIRDRWVAAVDQGRPEKRITLTYPPLESSRFVAFLVTGGGKVEMLKHVRSGASDVPAARLDTRGEVHIFADRAAVGD